MKYEWYRTVLAGCLMLLLCCFLAPSAGIAGPDVETLIRFDPKAQQNPESIVFDRAGNGYISMAFSGEIRRVRPDLSHETLMVMPIGERCGDRERVILGLAMDSRDLLYAAVTACDPANHGIWQIDPVSKAKRLVVKMPYDSVINGIDIHNGYLYGADTFKGLIWRAPVKGGEPVLWLDHPLMKRPAGSDPRFPGPNGLRFFERKRVPEIYVAVSTTGTIVAIPIQPDGSAGEPRVHVTLPKGMGGDEFTFDALGRIYVTTDPSNVLLMVNLDGTSDVLLTAVDGLDGPTSVVFGRTPGDAKDLYITNGAFPFFSQAPKPSLMRFKVDVPAATGLIR